MIKICLDCSNELKSKLERVKRCRSCVAKQRKNPMLNKQHLNREKFRKNTFANVNYDDRIEEFSPAGNSRKKYRMSCIQCGSDRGYQTHKDVLRVCTVCRVLNRTFVTKEQRHVRSCMRANLNSRLRQRLLSKNKKSTFDVLPYTVNELMAHLESKFERGMTWENHGQGPGTWQIDHVTPDSWFVYNSMDDQEFLNSWSLDNLQPLWWHDNCSKGNRYQG